MIRVDGDFYSNFSHAFRANDQEAMWDIYIDEISTLLAENRSSVVLLLNRNDIPIKDEKNDKELINAVLNGIAYSKKFRIGLAHEIAKKNKLLIAQRKKKARRLNAVGALSNSDKKRTSKDRDWGGLIESVGEIARGLGPMVQGFKNRRERNQATSQIHSQMLQKSAEARRRDQEIRDRQIALAKSRAVTIKAKKTRQAVFGTLAVIAVAGFGIYMYKRSKIKATT